MSRLTRGLNMFSLPFRSRISAIATLLFFVAALVAGGLTYDRQQELHQRVLDTVTWSLYQLDRSVSDLRVWVTDGDVEQALLDYEILYGRAAMLVEGQTRRFLEESEGNLDWSREVGSEVQALEPIIMSIATGDQALEGETQRVLVAALDRLQVTTRSMLLKHNEYVAQLRSRDTRELMRLYVVVLLCIVLIMAAGTILVMALIREGRAHTLKAELLEAQSRALRGAAQRAESANRAKTDFMAIMSHEMRTPLSGVMGMADLLKDEQLSEEGRQHIEGLEASAAGLRMVISDILDYTRIESGRLDIETSPFSLKNLLDQLALGYRTRPDGRVQFLMRQAPSLPENVEGDQHRLRQVLMNLLNNAFKFTEQGFVMLRVSRAEASRISFVVYDTGCGIADQDLGLIFQPFIQCDTTLAWRHEGTGLGLAISRSLVKAMGGDLRVDSQPGSGSRFWFEIPLPVSSREEVAEPPPRDDRLALPDPHHVLVVEDNSLNRDLVAAMLSRLGQSCELVANGEQALEALAERDFDLVLMDLQMPVMDGLETARRWREQEHQLLEQGRLAQPLPLVAVTANVLPHHRKVSFEAGMDDLISKPFTRRELRTILQRYPSRLYASLSTGLEQGGTLCSQDIIDPAEGGSRAVTTAQNVAVEDSQVVQEHLLDCHASSEQVDDMAWRLDNEVLAESTVKELCSVMSPAALERMVQGYLARFPARLERMYAAIEADDREALEQEAEELRSASAVMGCRAVVQAAIELADQLAEQDLQGLRARVKDIELQGARTGNAWRDLEVLRHHH